MNTLDCSCGSFVVLSSAFRSLSGDNLALASNSRMGQSHIFGVSTPKIFENIDFQTLFSWKYQTLTQIGNTDSWSSFKSLVTLPNSLLTARVIHFSLFWYIFAIGPTKSVRGHVVVFSFSPSLLPTSHELPRSLQVTLLLLFLRSLCLKLAPQLAGNGHTYICILVQFISKLILPHFSNIVANNESPKQSVNSL